MIIDDELYQDLMQDVDLDDIWADINMGVANGYDDEEYIKGVIRRDLDDSDVDPFFIDDLVDLLYANWYESEIDDEDEEDD